MDAVSCLFQVFQVCESRYTHRNSDFKGESGPDWLIECKWHVVAVLSRSEHFIIHCVMVKSGCRTDAFPLTCLLCFELLISRWLPTRRDHLQVESELCGDVGPEVLEALPVWFHGTAEHHRYADDDGRWEMHFKGRRVALRCCLVDVHLKLWLRGGQRSRMLLNSWTSRSPACKLQPSLA